MTTVEALSPGNVKAAGEEGPTGTESSFCRGHACKPGLIDLRPLQRPWLSPCTWGLSLGKLLRCLLDRPGSSFPNFASLIHNLPDLSGGSGPVRPIEGPVVVRMEGLHSPRWEPGVGITS